MVWYCFIGYGSNFNFGDYIGSTLCSYVWCSVSNYMVLIAMWLDMVSSMLRA